MDTYIKQSKPHLLTTWRFRHLEFPPVAGNLLLPCWGNSDQVLLSWIVFLFLVNTVVNNLHWTTIRPDKDRCRLAPVPLQTVLPVN